MDRLNLVEKLRTKTGITYEDAKMVLEINNWDILDAILDLERQGKIKGPSVSIFYTNEYNENYEEENYLQRRCCCNVPVFIRLYRRVRC